MGAGMGADAYVVVGRCEGVCVGVGVGIVWVWVWVQGCKCGLGLDGHAIHFIHFIHYIYTIYVTYLLYLESGGGVCGASGPHMALQPDRVLSRAGMPGMENIEPMKGLRKV